MRGTVAVIVVGVAVAGWLGSACGSEGASGFKCNKTAIANGQSIECQADGQFGSGAPEYECGPVGQIATKSLGPLGGGAAVICPVGTGLVKLQTEDPGGRGAGEGVREPPPISGYGASSSSGGSSSGGSSSGGSSSGGSSSGGSSSGGSSSGDGGASSSSGGSASSASSDGLPAAGGASAPDGAGSSCVYACAVRGNSTRCVCTRCDVGFYRVKDVCVATANNGVGNGEDPQPPGEPPVNDGAGTEPGSPGNQG